MKDKCRLGLGSVTAALIAQNSIAAQGIGSRIVRLEPSETPRGCAYGIELPCGSKKPALRALIRDGIRFTELI